jgi:hypothetical protein
VPIVEVAWLWRWAEVSCWSGCSRLLGGGVCVLGGGPVCGSLLFSDPLVCGPPFFVGWCGVCSWLVGGVGGGVEVPGGGAPVRGVPGSVCMDGVIVRRGCVVGSVVLGWGLLVPPRGRRFGCCWVGGLDTRGINTPRVCPRGRRCCGVHGVSTGVSTLNAGVLRKCPRCVHEGVHYCPSTGVSTAVSTTEPLTESSVPTGR